MNKKNLFIIGSRQSRDLLNYFDNHSDKYNLGIIIDLQDKPSKSLEDNYKILRLDMSSKKALFKNLKEHPNLKIDLTIARYENYVIQNTWICEYFNIPYFSERTAIVSRDKYLMRKAFQKKYPEITPTFRVVKNLKEAEEFVSKTGFPVMLKPTNFAKSLLINKNTNLIDLKKKFEYMQKAIPEIRKRYKYNDLETEIIIEEYIEGSKHSIQAFTDSVGNVYNTPIVDILNAEDVGWDDSFQYSRTLPTSLNASQIQEINTAAQKGVKALGLTNSAAHIEIILTKENKAKIIEIGARMGGYRPKIYRYSYNLDLNGLEISCQSGAIGEEFPNNIQFKAYCRAYEIFPNETMQFTKIIGEDVLKKSNSVIYYNLKATEGETVGMAKDGFKACVVIMICAKSKSEFNNINNYIENNVRVG
ncbi:MAG TPA: ATP-grasp domain-containing protein [Candidatus Dojkabacteria bacterium]|jgi:phosphoribosylamine-glycine ligase